MVLPPASWPSTMPTVAPEVADAGHTPHPIRVDGDALERHAAMLRGGRGVPQPWQKMETWLGSSGFDDRRPPFFTATVAMMVILTSFGGAAGGA